MKLSGGNRQLRCEAVSRPQQPTRRAFLQGGALVLSGLATTAWPRAILAAGSEADPTLRIGLLTDCHYADRPAAGTRFYRESLDKIAEAVERFNTARIDMAVELGDLIDEAPDVAGEIGFLKLMEAAYARLQCDRHYVLGNHCVWTLTKQEFIDNCAMEKPHYSFDKGDYHFVVLDACYRQDGEPYGRKNYEWTDSFLPPAELEWLKGDLAAATKPTIVLAHQRLDGSPDERRNWQYTVKNAPDVRKVMEESGRVAAVFQGHSHQNDYREVGGIHYCVVRAVVEGSGAENNGYGILKLYADGSLRIEGFRQQAGYEWQRAGV